MKNIYPEKGKRYIITTLLILSSVSSITSIAAKPTWWSRARCAWNLWKDMGKDPRGFDMVSGSRVYLDYAAPGEKEKLLKSLKAPLARDLSLTAGWVSAEVMREEGNSCAHYQHNNDVYPVTQLEAHIGALQSILYAVSDAAEKYTKNMQMKEPEAPSEFSRGGLEELSLSRSTLPRFHEKMGAIIWYGAWQKLRILKDMLAGKIPALPTIIGTETDLIFQNITPVQSNDLTAMIQGVLSSAGGVDEAYEIISPNVPQKRKKNADTLKALLEKERRLVGAYETMGTFTSGSMSPMDYDHCLISLPIDLISRHMMCLQETESAVKNFLLETLCATSGRDIMIDYLFNGGAGLEKGSQRAGKIIAGAQSILIPIRAKYEFLAGLLQQQWPDIF